MTRGLREILIEAANAIADAIEGKASSGPPSKARRAASVPQSEMSELDERASRCGRHTTSAAAAKLKRADRCTSCRVRPRDTLAHYKDLTQDQHGLACISDP